MFYFVLCSFIGWVLETLRFLSRGKLVNRGFLTGPFCIIYGFCALLIMFINDKIKIKNKILKTGLISSFVYKQALNFFDFFEKEVNITKKTDINF